MYSTYPKGKIICNASLLLLFPLVLLLLLVIKKTVSMETCTTFIGIRATDTIASPLTSNIITY